MRKIQVGLEEIAIPPKALNVYIVGNSHLGHIAFDLTAVRGSMSDVLKFRKKFKRQLVSPIQTFPGNWSYNYPSQGSISINPSSPLPRDSQTRASSHGEKRPRDPAKTSKTDRTAVVGHAEAGNIAEMRQLSQPPGLSDAELQKFGKLGKMFWNYESPGKGQVVFVIDSGFGCDVRELRDVKYGEWIHAGSFPGDRKGPEKGRQYSQDDSLHGCVVISKIAGRLLGAAQDATIIPVTFSSGRPPGCHSALGVVDAFVKVYDQVRSVYKKTNCLVNLSLLLPIFYFKPIEQANLESFRSVYGLQPPFDSALHYLLKEFSKLPNVIVVISAGNYPGEEVRATPASLGGKAGLRKKVVVVGGTDLLGNNIFATDTFVKVSAPAQDVARPVLPVRGEKTSGIRGLSLKYGVGRGYSGTSFAAPLVTGVLAAMLSSGIPIDKVVDHMYKLAYPRVEGGPNVVYNGISTDRWKEEAVADALEF
ncbi:hypothetical protein TWF506_008116 [Arthrobotrys conoides]|uniref:Peptidase S8/S53 domain-containing protein n=1 Tax=Arthrobotrys conoides TaxID=74498 RepID=A0AAN8RTM8_9PEZI